MSETRESAPGTGTPAGTGRAEVPQQRAGEPQETGWVSLVYFAAFMALLAGGLQAIAGIVALVDEGYYLVGRNDLVVHLTYNEWGWIHLGIGVLLLAVGFGLLAGQTWARVFGIAIAGLSAIANFTWIAAYPAWSIVLIAVDVFVIYALAVHGREVQY
jgi:hypothetical protein